MPVVSTRTFSRLLSGLDDEARRSFVADLYRARGWEVRMEPGHVTATDPVTGSRHVVASTVERATAAADRDGDVAVVLAAAPSIRTERRVAAAGARLLGAQSVRNMALYAVDRETADELFERYFDRSVHLSEAEAARDAEAGEPWRRVVVAAVVVVAALAGVAAVLGGGPGAFSPPGDGTATQTTARAATAGAATPTREPTPEGDGDRAALPPMFGGDAVDAAAVSRRHVRALTDRSYRWVVTHNGTRSVDGRRWDDSVRVLEVANRSTYRYSVDGRVTTATDVSDVSYEVYADGEHRYQRVTTPNGTHYLRSPARDEAETHLAQAGIYIRRYLATTEARVYEVLLGGVLFYHVEATGTPTELDADDPPPTGGDDLTPPFDEVTNYSADAYVLPSGIVVTLRVSYTVDGERVGFEFTYDDLGETRTEPPDWYREARNATG